MCTFAALPHVQYTIHTVRDASCACGRSVCDCGKTRNQLHMHAMHRLYSTWNMNFSCNVYRMLFIACAVNVLQVHATAYHPLVLCNTLICGSHADLDCICTAGAGGCARLLPLAVRCMLGCAGAAASQPAHGHAPGGACECMHASGTLPSVWPSMRSKFAWGACAHAPGGMCECMAR